MPIDWREECPAQWIGKVCTGLTVSNGILATECLVECPGPRTRSCPGSRNGKRLGVEDPELGFHPDFDNRDGQMLIGFNTAVNVPPGLGKSRYQVSSAKIFVTIKSDSTFGYDPTVDPYTSWLPSTHPDFTPDPDPGRPLEIFGAAFRCDFAPPTYPETGPFCDSCSCFPPNPCVSVRCVYPIDYDESCQPRDVSNNVTEEFDPVPFGVAATGTLQPGDSVPQLTESTKAALRQVRGR